MTLSRLIPVAIAAALAACSGAEEPGPPPDPALIDDPRLTPEGDTNVSGADADDSTAVTLAALDAADVAGRLTGELTCVFADGAARPLLFTGANVGPDEPITALIKTGGGVMALTAGSGGYDRMADGASWSGEGLTAEVAVTGADTTPGQEGLSFPATLTAERADGDAGEWPGVWSCGP